MVSRSSLSQEEQEKWTGSLENGDQDAYVALLLSSLPNLERLDLVLPALLEDCFKKVVNSAAMKRNENLFQPQQAFSSLRVVVNDCDRNVQYASPKLLSEYLRLPSLREFYGRKIRSHCEEASDGLATLEPATVPLVHLELRNSKLNMIDMTNILRAFKHLKTFVYEVGWGVPTYSTFSTPEIGKALSWTESSLENLWLDCKGTWNCCFLAGHVAHVKTLSSFKVLKNLRVDMYILFGDEGFGISPVGPDRPGNTHDLVSILPASIETLYFSHTKRRMKVLTSALEKLLQAKESCTPKLRRIAFEADITGMDDAFDYSRLDFLAGEGGVEIAKIDSDREDRGRGKDGSLTASIISGLFSSPSVLDFEYLYMTRPTLQMCHQTQGSVLREILTWDCASGPLRRLLNRDITFLSTQTGEGD